MSNPGRNKAKDKEIERYTIDPDNILWIKINSTKLYDNPYRLMVPQALKHDILQSYHDNLLDGHRGVQTTYVKIRDRFH